MRASLASVALLWLPAACSMPESGAGQGRLIAERWCAECHRVAPDQPSGSRAGHVLPPPVAAPSFMSIAARPEADAYYLRRFMADLHPPMPTYRLGDQERESWSITFYRSRSRQAEQRLAGVSLFGGPSPIAVPARRIASPRAASTPNGRA